MSTETLVPAATIAWLLDEPIAEANCVRVYDESPDYIEIQARCPGASAPRRRVQGVVAHASLTQEHAIALRDALTEVIAEKWPPAVVAGEMLEGYEAGVGDAINHIRLQLPVWTGTGIAPEHLIDQLLRNLEALKDKRSKGVSNEQ